ncbi:MAG: hypothetical protein VYC34_11785 [Planctomycetota bacterium]|nr:hypothetical protein [Planctomycetota bacterium]
MPTSYGALCSDFYINAKLSVKMDLPTGRETVMDFFDRVRREFPIMSRLRRFEGETALESTTQEDGRQQWLALRRTSLRAGVVNPPSLAEAYKVHDFVLSTAPFYLTVSPLDVECQEVVFGFDLEAPGNHHLIVLDALYKGSAFANVLDGEKDPALLDVQPYLAVALAPRCDLQAIIEVKPRTSAREIRSGQFRDDPISVYLTVRKFGPVEDVKELPERFDAIAGEAEKFAEQRVLPQVITPLREAIASSRF